jgi:hypothetical protein
MFVDRRGTAEPQGQKLVRGAREPKGVVGGSRDSGVPSATEPFLWNHS